MLHKRPSINKPASRATVGTVLGVVLWASPASADIVMFNLSWQFDQGGYLQTSPSVFDVYQSMYGPNLRYNEISHSLGGASFTSIAAMTTDLTEREGLLRFEAFSELHVTASVDESEPLGLADAYAGLSLYIVQFEILSGEYLYTGSHELNGGIPSGSTLGPGRYAHGSFNDVWAQTPLVGPGEELSETAEQMFWYEFVAVPAPSSVVALLATVLLSARQRRRRDY